MFLAVENLQGKSEPCAVFLWESRLAASGLQLWERSRVMEAQEGGGVLFLF